MITRLRAHLRQRTYTRHHREHERADGFRLAHLDDRPYTTFGGYRPWCDARLQDCPNPGDDLCCYCTHTDRNPYDQ